VYNSSVYLCAYLTVSCLVTEADDDDACILYSIGACGYAQHMHWLDKKKKTLHGLVWDGNGHIWLVVRNGTSL